MTRTGLCVAALACGCTWADTGEGWTDPAPSMPAWTGEFEAGADGSPIRIETVEYDLEVFDTHVSACFETTFTASSGSGMSAVHRFALPAGAVIHHAELLVDDGNRWEVAETLGRAEGESAFEDVMEREPPPPPVNDDGPHCDPLLLQQIGTDAYRARVFPVGESTPLVTRICWIAPLEADANGERLRLPFHDAGDPEARTADALEIDAALRSDRWDGAHWTSSAAEDVVEASGSAARLVASDFALDRELVLELGAGSSASVRALGYRSEAEIADHLFVRWVPDLSDVPSVAPGPRHVVFVLDVSGSMQGAKFDAASAVVRRALEALDAEDEWGLVVFDSEARAFRDTMSAGDDVSEAIRWVTGLALANGTNIAGGLALGAQIGATSASPDAAIDLFLLTDGRPSAGATTVDAMLTEIDAAAVDRDVRVFTCGIGSDLDAALLGDLADSTGGEATLALEDSDIEASALALFDRIRPGGVSDVHVVVGGVGIETTEAYEWPRIFPGSPLGFGAIAADAAETVSVSLVGTAPDGEPVEVAAEVVPDVGSDGAALAAPPLAAVAWAERLAREIDAEGETPERVLEAVLVAKRYGVLTRYSSVLAMENDQMYADAGIDRIARDPAGIATEDVPASTFDEFRVGGAGVDSTLGFESAASGNAAGCSCTTGGPGSLAPLVLAMLFAVPRRRRRRAG